MIDNVNPEGAWKFDESVAACFDNMLERSIPQYQIMRESCTNLTKRYAKNYSKIIDIGCSNGLMMKYIAESLEGFNGDIVGYEISDPMIESARQLFSDRNNLNFKKNSMPNISIIKHDLKTGLPYSNDKASVILSVLTIQFIPIEYRHKVIKSVYDSLEEGGAFIFVEKMLGNTNEINQLMVDEYYRMKSDNGYTYDQINRKRLSLEGVLVPITSKWNEDILRETGFRQIDCFWRWMNFGGFVAIK